MNVLRMKSVGVMTLLFSVSLISFAQADSGFTNKVEAKNILKHGKKEGKWVEYYGYNKVSVYDTTKAFDYTLTVYKHGVIIGIQRDYYFFSAKFKGKLKDEFLYKEGKKDGLQKEYYPDGTLEYAIFYVNDSAEGAYKTYWPNGNLKYDYTLLHHKSDGVQKEYYYSGKLMDVSTFKNGKYIESKDYYENGKEITDGNSPRAIKCSPPQRYYPKDPNEPKQDTIKKW